MVYTLPTGFIVCKHNMFHLYADDTQLYLSFDINDSISALGARIIMESCITDIQSWMLLNCLKLNGNKTEFLHFKPHKKGDWLHNATAISVGADIILPSNDAKNLGVIFDSDQSLNSHISSICKATNFQLFRISRI